MAGINFVTGAVLQEGVPAMVVLGAQGKYFISAADFCRQKFSLTPILFSDTSYQCKSTGCWACGCTPVPPS